MSLAVLTGQPQSESTELESLLYSMLYAATKGKLHWGAYLHTDSAARDVKLAAMVVDDEFESVVVSRIDDLSLKSVAKCVRALFFQDGKRLQGVQFKKFVAAIDQGFGSWMCRVDVALCLFVLSNPDSQLLWWKHVTPTSHCILYDGGFLIFYTRCQHLSEVVVSPLVGQWK